jgi:ABC-2 type transport system ATP-binding protein
MGALDSDVVRTEGLTKHFGAVHAVDGLDLAIERGEVFGYLAPNGAVRVSAATFAVGARAFQPRDRR